MTTPVIFVTALSIQVIYSLLVPQLHYIRITFLKSFYVQKA